MDAVNKLLDKARATCSLPSDVALAEKLGVSRQLVSQWRKGANPLSDDRIAQVAHLAKDDGGRWLLLIHAERASGAAAKDWAALVRKFGAAAAVGAVALLSLGVIDVSAQDGVQSAASAMLLNVVSGMHYAK
jgi:transcriptional regulator with XRE-family HTH domain